MHSEQSTQEMLWYSLRVISGKEKDTKESILREAEEAKINSEIEFSIPARSEGYGHPNGKWYEKYVTEYLYEEIEKLL